MDNFVIKTENLTKDYSSWLRKAKKPALKDLTISIPKGSVFGFLGPNGAGKTTTIKILMGLIRPTGGTATVLGKPYDDVEVKNRIGFLPAAAFGNGVSGCLRKTSQDSVFEAETACSGSSGNRQNVASRKIQSGNILARNASACRYRAGDSEQP